MEICTIPWPAESAAADTNFIDGYRPRSRCFTIPAVASTEGLESIEYTDRYLEPISGGRDLQLAVRFQNFACELQLSVGLLVAVTASGHRSFVVAREVAAAVEMGDVGSCR